MPELPLTFEEGLDESQEDSALPPGTASLLENWVPEPNGGLRCRRSWSNASTTSAPATRRARGIGFFSVDNQTGDVKSKVGSFAANTVTGNQAITGVGFQGKALILWTTGAATAVDTFTNDLRYSMGFATSVSDAYSVSMASDGGVAPNTSTRIAQQALTIVQWGEVTDADAAFVSFDADGFTINWTNAPASAYIVNYMVLGGTDLSNAKVVKWNTRTSTGTTTVTGVGFQPEMILNIHPGGPVGSTVLPSTVAGAAFGFGAATGTSEDFAVADYIVDAGASSDTNRRISAGACLTSVDATASDLMTASLSSFNSDGFVMNFTTAEATARPVITLALKGSSMCEFKVGDITKPATTLGASSTTGVGFTPTGLMLVSPRSNAGSGVHIGLGASSGAASSKSAALREGGSLASSDAQTFQSDTFLVQVNPTVASSQVVAASLTSFDADGFTLNYTTNDSNTSAMFYIAVGGARGSGLDKVLVAQNDASTNFDIYSLNTTQLSSGTWSAIDSNIAVTDPLPLVQFASGLGQTLYTHRKFSLVRRYDGSAVATIAGSPAGRTIAFHKNRFWVGGTEANPTRLWYSDLASYSTWGATSYIDIGKDDGEAIEDLAVFENGLLIAKRNSLWFLSGASPDEFAVQPLNAGGGHAGRCIAATPYGAVVAGRRHVWLWTGAGVENISKSIEESYSVANSDFVTTAYIDGEAYICDESTGTKFIVDMQRGVWRTEKVESPATEGPAVIAAKSDKLYYGPQEATTISLLAYKELPGSSRTIDAGLGITYKAHTPELWPVKPGYAMTPLHLDIKYRQRGATGSGELTIVRVYDGATLATLTLPLQAAAGTYRETVMVGDNDQGKGISSAMFKFEHSVGVGENISIDIESIELHFENVGPRRG